MPNPLTVFIPVKQDDTTQKIVAAIHQAGFSPSTNQAMFTSELVHYARVVAIPNANGQGIQALIVITEFDNAMIPYVKFFFDNASINQSFTAIAETAVNPPLLPLELNNFTAWVVKNNLTNDPSTMFSAYPQTVRQIRASFPPQ